MSDKFPPRTGFELRFDPHGLDRHDAECPTQNGATPDPCDCGATITAPISLTPEEWDRVGELLADVCTIWWTGPCEIHGDEWHRCARLTDHDGDHGCECGQDSPLVTSPLEPLPRLPRFRSPRLLALPLEEK